MLVQLTISNFAIISRLDVLYKPGLNIISGETGAGKSIIINAVNLLLGGRASTDLVRSGADEARVEALFELPEDSPAHPLLEEMGFPCSAELVVKRIISLEGRNRVMINGSIATLQHLSRLGIMLMSISGQHEHQSLLRPESHLFFLDDFGDLESDRLALNVRFNAYRKLQEQKRRLEREIQRAEEKQELAGFQMEEIDKADILVGEDALLDEEKKRLQSARMLLELVNQARRRLYEDDHAVISSLSSCAKDVEKAAAVDPKLEAVCAVLESVRVNLEEAVLELRAFEREIVIDPSRLEQVEERRHLINQLKRKYGPGLEDVLKFKDRIAEDMVDLAEKKFELEKAGRALREAEADLLSRSAQLSEKRKAAAEKLQLAMAEELALLDMPGVQFEVRFSPEQNGCEQNADADGGLKLKADGWDAVEFMISPNVGEGLKPLSRIASGGELSRVMLAFKTILARTASVETIVFDEIDSGIAGATAEVVGEKLQNLARYHQILCITHLPQIASKGQSHFKVEKRVLGERTESMMSELDLKGRIQEVARLLGGRTVSPKAVAHAKEMLRVNS